MSYTGENPAPAQALPSSEPTANCTPPTALATSQRRHPSRTERTRGPYISHLPSFKHDRRSAHSGSRSMSRECRTGAHWHNLREYACRDSTIRSAIERSSNTPSGSGVDMFFAAKGRRHELSTERRRRPPPSKPTTEPYERLELPKPSSPIHSPFRVSSWRTCTAPPRARFLLSPVPPLPTPSPLYVTLVVDNNYPLAGPSVDHLALRRVSCVAGSPRLRRLLHAGSVHPRLQRTFPRVPVIKE
ncbi:hypothetical protein BKA93DRAFT_116963 [Sparassis latifolia]